MKGMLIMSSCKHTQALKRSDYTSPIGKSRLSVDSHKNFFDKFTYKKTSSAFLHSGLRAGMSVEAALCLPIFLFFMINLLSLFIMYESYSKNLSVLHNEGKSLAMLAHGTEVGDELVHLTREQRISPLYKEIGFDRGLTSAQVYIRKWTGYNVMSTTSVKEEEEYVYITESGTVYHRNRDCSHLRISVSVLKASDIGSSRNAYGKKYLPCEKCASGSSTGLVFVTDKGDRYHNSAACSGLKRTILTVPISETGGRGPCSLCGG